MTDSGLSEAEVLIIEAIRVSEGPVNLAQIKHPRTKDAFEELHGRYITGTVEAANYLPHPKRSKENNLNTLINQCRLCAKKKSNRRQEITMFIVNRMLFVTTFFCIACNFVLFGTCYAKSAKQDYDLQEKCGDTASKFFKKEDFSLATKDIVLFKNYKNHYNKKLNKCFILITSKLKRLNTNDVSESQIIFDVNENMEYGSIAPSDKGIRCVFLGNSCGSWEEWHILIRPYMEE